MLELTETNILAKETYCCDLSFESSWKKLKYALGWQKEYLSSLAIEVTGEGITIAIIDSGYKHCSSLIDSSRHIETQDHTPLKGHDMTDILGHGTQMTGILHSKYSPAKNASFFHHKVFDYNSTHPFDVLHASLEHLIKEIEKDALGFIKPDIVNLAMSDGRNFPDERSSYSRYRHIIDLFNELEKLGIIIVAPSGNSYNGEAGMSFPGVCKSVLSVGSIDITETNEHTIPYPCQINNSPKSSTDILVPGTHIPTLDSDAFNSFISISGTSASCAVATSCLCLLKEFYNAYSNQHTPNFNLTLVREILRPMSKRGDYNPDILNMNEALENLNRLIIQSTTKNK